MTTVANVLGLGLILLYHVVSCLAADMGMAGGLSGGKNVED